ncbi:unnamed protein product [Adineta steineri]|uniref:Fibronectin type-III domain-containing protein n=1 Tax=Adineta steineri TaxID=433720 RepID=A0A819GC21_9BILA|nr:unnamed protein product [Adineta steineri]
MELSRPSLVSICNGDECAFLSWSSVINATQYEVEVKHNNTGVTTLYCTTSTSFLITKLENGEFYIVQVTALNNTERSESSIGVMLKPKLRQSLSKLFARSTEQPGRIRLQWTSTPTDCGFQIERCNIGNTSGYKRIAWLPFNNIMVYEDQTDCLPECLCPGHYYTVAFRDTAWSSGAGVLSRDSSYGTSNATIIHIIKVRVRPRETICQLETSDEVLIGDFLTDVWLKSGLDQPSNHYYLMFAGQELNLDETIRNSGLLDAVGCNDENCPELRLKLLYKLDESAHLATNIVLTSLEELVYKDVFEISYCPTQQQIMPEILEPLVKRINENKSQSLKYSSNLISMPVFTKQVIDELPSLYVTVPLKLTEFDSNEFLQCLAKDLEIDRNDMFLMNVQEGSTKYQIKFKTKISLCLEKMKKIAEKIKVIVLPSSKSAEFIARQKSLGNIEEIPRIDIKLDDVAENADSVLAKTLASDDIDATLAIMQRPAIVDPPIWEYLTQKSRKISSGILHAFQTSTVEYVIESMSLVHNEELYHKYNNYAVEGEEAILFHGTKTDYLDDIFSTNFKTFYTSGSHHITDSGWYGQGTYFSSSPKYCASYAGSSYNSITYLICSLVKLGKVYHVKDMLYQGKPMRSDADTHYVKVDTSGSPTNAKHSFFEEFVIKKSDQILPLYLVGLRRIHRFVLWRDAKINNSENGTLFNQMKQRYSFNVYGSETSLEALTILRCKLADSFMQCVVVTNGADNGENFAQECRNIRPLVPIIVFCANVDYHKQWAENISGSDQPQIQVTGNSSVVFTFISTNFPSGDVPDKN